MDYSKSQEAIEQTRNQIYKLKQQIEETIALREKHWLKRQLKELQYLQLWQLDQVGWKNKEPGHAGFSFYINDNNL